MRHISVALVAAVLFAGCSGTPCVDADGDGFGEGCSAGPDCDDSSASANEDGTEICDGLDNDCDGRFDEVCSCREGATQKCFAGEARHRGIGPCVEGTQTCVGGAWGACEGSGSPSAESCNGADDDCDGPVDEEVTQACYSGPEATKGVGACREGGLVCREARFQGVCSGEVLPSNELCNNIDDDCDGVTDEALARTCFDGAASARNVGACHEGTQQCGAGAWGSCTGQVLPVTETCNDIDDDCDGKTDEFISRNCYAGPAGTVNVGVCKAGVETCTAGAFGSCAGEVMPGSETCNNLDDDCDGQTDEGVSTACYSGPVNTRGVGQCSDGTRVCANGAFGACNGDTLPGTETCGNGIDEDCDGAADESCGPGDSCLQPFTLATVQPTVTADGTLEDAGIADDFSGCGPTGARDLVYAFSLNATERVTIDAVPDAGFNVALSVYGNGTSCPGTQLSCANMAGAGAVERFNQVLAPGTYYAVVEEGLSNAGGGAYSLSLTRSTPASGDSCANALFIDGGAATGGDAGVQTFFGDTSVAGADINTGTCGDQSTGDLVYSFDLPVGKTLTAVVDGGTWAPALAVRTGATCPGNTPSGCSSSAVPGARSLTVDLPAGRHDLIVRGGAPNASGPYQLDVRFGGQLTYVQSASPQAYLDACTGGTSALVNAAHNSAALVLPFDFLFWGQNRPAGSTLRVQSNGYLTFDATSPDVVYGPLGATTSPNAVIAPFWTHLHPRSFGVCHRVDGVAPNRKWIIEWRLANEYDLTTSGTTTFEAVLSEGTGDIDFIYSSVIANATGGVENDDGTRVVTRTAPAASGTAVRFSPILP